MKSIRTGFEKSPNRLALSILEVAFDSRSVFGFWMPTVILSPNEGTTTQRRHNANTETMSALPTHRDHNLGWPTTTPNKRTHHNTNRDISTQIAFWMMNCYAHTSYALWTELCKVFYANFIVGVVEDLNALHKILVHHSLLQKTCRINGLHLAHESTKFWFLTHLAFWCSASNGREWRWNDVMAFCFWWTTGQTEQVRSKPTDLSSGLCNSIQL